MKTSEKLGWGLTMLLYLVMFIIGTFNAFMAFFRGDFTNMIPWWAFSMASAALLELKGLQYSAYKMAAEEEARFERAKNQLEQIEHFKEFKERLKQASDEFIDKLNEEIEK